jgi:hypothetical protein
MRPHSAGNTRPIASNPNGLSRNGGSTRVSLLDATYNTTRSRLRRLLDAKSWSTWIDLVLVTIMSIASLAAAWCGYQATNWSSQQSDLNSQANTVRMEEIRVSSSANAQLAVEVVLFNGWADVRNDPALMEFYRNRMLPETQAALDAWIATSPLTNPTAPLEPFAMEGFQIPAQAQAIELDQQATSLTNQGQEASQNTSRYVLDAVLLALVLFFAGLASKLGWRPAQLFATCLSGLLLIAILVQMALNPIA